VHRAQRGDDVWVLDDLSRRGSHERMQELERLDNVSRFPYPIAGYPLHEFATFDAIVHLAAQVAVTRSFVNPIKDAERNILATLQLLEHVRQAGSKPRIIFTSTNKVYGNILDRACIPFPILPVNPVTPYGVSKAAADWYMQDYARQFKIPTVVLRMSCVYGPHQTAESDQGWIAHFADCALKKKRITIYGTGAQVRDVLHISDLVGLFDSLLERDTEPGTVYNVGGGPDFAVSVLEAIKLLEEVTGESITFGFEDWRSGDQMYYVSDLTKVREETGWAPKVPPREGFEDLIRWMRKQ